MAAEQVRAVVDVKSENFHQVVEESIATDSTTFYEQLIAANERLRIQLSKIFTEFVNKARLEQEANGDQKKRKTKRNTRFHFTQWILVFFFFHLATDENEDEEEDAEPEPSDNDEDDADDDEEEGDEQP